MLQFVTLLVATFPLFPFTQAVPAANLDAPKLTLPWGTYIAEPYGNDGSVSLSFITIEEVLH
jgi:hypothetical protein